MSITYEKELERIQTEMAEIAKKRDAIQAERAKATATLEEQAKKLEKQLWDVREALHVVEGPFSKEEEPLAGSADKYHKAIESLENNIKKRDAKFALFEVPFTTPENKEKVRAALTFIMKQGMQYSWEEKKLREIKHPTHTVLGYTSEKYRIYVAFDKKGKLAAILTTEGGGHPGAWVRYEAYGVKLKDEERGFRDVQFREWVNPEKTKFIGLSKEEAEKFIKRASLTEYPVL